MGSGGGEEAARMGEVLTKGVAVISLLLGECPRFPRLVAFWTSTQPRLVMGTPAPSLLVNSPLPIMSPHSNS